MRQQKQLNWLDQLCRWWFLRRWGMVYPARPDLLDKLKEQIFLWERTPTDYDEVCKFQSGAEMAFNAMSEDEQSRRDRISKLGAFGVKLGKPEWRKKTTG